MEGLRGAVHARSSNGPVTITDVVGDVEVFTSNAKVSCSCTCGSLKARSSNSKILLDQHRGSVDASTSNGSVSSDFDILVTSSGRNHLEGTIGDGEAELTVRSSNGSITVR